MPKKSTENEDCTSVLQSFVENHWKFSNNDSLLINTAELEKEVFAIKSKAKECIIGEKKEPLMALLGTPHQIVELDSGRMNWYYFTLMNCYPWDKTKYCQYFLLRFNQTNYCTDFHSGTLAVSH
jgi:hypothetical protein